jgi:hypothetical protein|tara:strand:- start:3683 stop:3868 length:186 start_codon:yes stop_codon:yes gene_type:complete
MNERGDTGLISVTSFHVKIPTVLVYCNFSIYSEFPLTIAKRWMSCLELAEIKLYVSFLIIP